MITDAVFGVLYAVIDALVSILPDWDMPDFGDGLQGALNTIGNLNMVIPVHATFVAFAAIVATLVTFQVWALAVWVWHQIHGAD